MISIQNVLKKIDALEPIPQITNQVLEITLSDDHSTQDLADIILHDSAITANLLKICNSPYMGLPMEVNSVHKAVSLLGLNQVIDLVLMKAVGKNLLRSQKGYQLAQGELWKQSVASALVSKHFAEQRGVHDKFLVYTAALLKDMGKIIIENYVGKSLSKIMHLVEKKGFSFDEAERDILG